MTLLDDDRWGGGGGEGGEGGERGVRGGRRRGDADRPTKFSYTPATWAKLIVKPEDRRKAAQSYIESVGGKLHGFGTPLGTHDGYTLWEAPDNASMAAVALAITGGGALRLVGNDSPSDGR